MQGGIDVKGGINIEEEIGQIVGGIDSIDNIDKLEERRIAIARRLYIVTIIVAL